MEPLSYDPIKDLEPITLLTSTPLILAVPGSSTTKTFGEFIEAVKAKPGIRYGSTGVGTSQHLAAILLGMDAQLRMQHVPYKIGSQALNDLMTGQLPAMFYFYSAISSPAKEGKIRLLAVTSKERFPALSEVATISESGYPNYEMTSWLGLAGPAGMPKAVVERLNKATRAVLASKEISDHLLPDGASVISSTPEEMRQFMISEVKKWADVVHEAGIKQ
jgi:tripartite-type tricarboxylate transporter receptor subunit TctC